MHKFDYTYKTNETNDSVDIHIYGVIGYDEAYWDEGTNNTAFALVSLIKRMDKQYGRINVHINSPGGLIDSGLAIYNTLKKASADVHTYNSGFVGSMASIIILAGTTHFPTTSIYHLHRASSGVRGNINAMEAEIEALKVYEDTLQSAIVAKTGLTKEEVIAKWFDGNEHFMTATQAQELGFVDVLESEMESDPPAAVNQLQNLKYAAVMNMYVDTEAKEGDPKTILQKMRDLFKQNKQDGLQSTPKNHTHKNSNMKTLKSGVLALIAILGVSEFKLNAENNIEMEIDEAIRLNSEIEKLQTKANKLETAAEAHAGELETLNAKIAELEAVIDGTPIKDEGDGKGADVPPEGAEKIDVTAETLADLEAYNKRNNIK